MDLKTRAKQKPGEGWRFKCGHTCVLPKEIGESNNGGHWCKNHQNKRGGAWVCSLCHNACKRRLYHNDSPNKRLRRRKLQAVCDRRRLHTTRGRVINSLSCAIRSCIKGRGAFRILPYTRDELCGHIESELKRYHYKCPLCHVDISQKFDIDHRIPLSSAEDSKESVLALFALSNLSVLCANCNRNVKRDKIINY